MDRGNVLVRWFGQIVRDVIRFILPAAIRGAWWALRMFAVGLSSVFTGFPIAARRIAEMWVDQAFRSGFPSRYDATLYRCMVIIAWAYLILAWIITSFLTVWLVRVLLHWLF
jgi:hypothetical protein